MIKFPYLKYFANASEERDGFFISNASNWQDDWVQLSPYGDFPNERGMQRVNKEDAQNIVDDFNKLINTPQRVLGRPWYIGHPDDSSFSNRHIDTKAYGRIKALEAREDGLYANVKFNPDGKKLIESECFHGHSVNWGMRQEGKVWRPVCLKSVGFTNEPNIPVRTILAANEERKNMLEYIKKLFGMKDESTEDEAKTQVNSVNDKAIKYDETLTKLAANEAKLVEKDAAIATAQATITVLTGEKETFANESKANDGRAQIAEGKVGAAEKKATDLEVTFSNERKARIELLVGGGIQSGKITPAEKAQWEKDFVNEFDKSAERLTKAGVKMHTTTNLNVHREPATSDRREKIAHFVNEEMSKPIYYNLSQEQKYSKAHYAVQQAHTELFQVQS